MKQDMRDLWRFELKQGNSLDPRQGACLLDAVSWMEYGHMGDYPACVCPVLGTFGRYLNDMLPHDERQALRAYIPRLVGTVDCEATRHRIDALVRSIVTGVVPFLLDLSGFRKEAARLRQPALQTWPAYSLGWVVDYLLQDAKRRMAVEAARAPMVRSYVVDGDDAASMAEFLRSAAARDCQVWTRARCMNAVGVLEMAQALFDRDMYGRLVEFVPLSIHLADGQGHTMASCMALVAFVSAKVAEGDLGLRRIAPFTALMLSVFDAMLAVGRQAEPLPAGRMGEASDSFERARQHGTLSASYAMPPLHPAHA